VDLKYIYFVQREAEGLTDRVIDGCSIPGRIDDQFSPLVA